MYNNYHKTVEYGPNRLFYFTMLPNGVILYFFSPEECSKSMVEILKTAKSGTVWITESGDKYQYVMPDRFTIKN